ncbi:MAG: epimerase [Elusimicrobia bacterium]|nr:epimerase [Elusimicrobiota bacterium]
MRLLIIGGTQFLGRHIAEAALSRGDEVTLLHRGKTGRELFPRVRRLTADRSGDLSVLKGGRWDAAIDTCGYVPSVVRRGAEALRGSVSTYVFISTVSVYSDWSRDCSETDEVSSWSGPEPAERAPVSYGPLKAGCEVQVREVFGPRALVIRPGLIAGPWDPTDRFTYWPLRLARGGVVLAPGRPERLVQVIDSRDLARWTVAMAVRGAGGTFNACGRQIRMDKILSVCAEASGLSSRLEWVSEEFLREQGAVPYTEIPLWIPGQDDAFDCRAAEAAGLERRELSRTVRDVLDWRATEGEELKAGLTAAREAELLSAYRRRDAAGAS